MLEAAFVRTVGERDRIYVTRSDGSTVSWVFATYGDALPHDLVHLVVESAFGIAGGALANVRWLADATSPAELLHQALAACAEAGPRPPAALSAERVEHVRSALADLTRRWRGFTPKGTLVLGFEPRDPERGFADNSSRSP